MARIRLYTLQLQKQEGGVALSHPISYFLASQLQHVGGCDTEKGQWEGKMILQITPHNSLVEIMEAGSFLHGPPTLDLMIRVWEAVKKILGYIGLTEYTPLWEKKQVGGRAEVGDN